MLYLLLDSSGESEGKKKKLIRHMQLYFSLCESKTESTTVSCSHKMVHLQGTGLSSIAFNCSVKSRTEQCILQKRNITQGVSQLFSPIGSTPFPDVFYASHQSLQRWDSMGCSGHGFPSAQKLVPGPVTWFSCSACDFQYIVVSPSTASFYNHNIIWINGSAQSSH